jgi:cell division protein ZapE
MGPVEERYRAKLAQHSGEPDPSQAAGLAALERCARDWKHYKSQRGGRLAKVFVHPPLPRGIYLWGGVGRGKTFLMDCFYDVVPLERKLRVHFHEFMRGVHREMYDLRGTEDPLSEVALRVARRYRLICFDEFHISDIADAMILERLLMALVKARVGFVMTSNYPPSGLYPDGLHRDRLLPAIRLLEQQLDVVELTAGDDHRRRDQSQAGQSWLATHGLRSSDFYLTLPAGGSGAATGAASGEGSGEGSEEGSGSEPDALQRVFDALADGPREENGSITIEGREVAFLRRAGGVIWFAATALIGGPRSMHDYLWLAQNFHTVILSEVSQLNRTQFSEARRLTWLVDVFYDHRTRLAISAQVAPDALYTEGPMASEFRRTASRLVEMKAESYLSADRRRGVERIS